MIIWKQQKYTNEIWWFSNSLKSTEDANWGFLGLSSGSLFVADDGSGILSKNIALHRSKNGNS